LFSESGTGGESAGCERTRGEEFAAVEDAHSADGNTAP
jgi:hypothetical protein